MKKINTTLILIMVSNLLLGQITFQKSYGGLPGYRDYGYSVKQTSDGGFVISGSVKDTSLGGADYDKAILIKVDSYGDTSWTKTYGDTVFDGSASEVVQTMDGGYIMVVRRGNLNAHLIKTDVNGNTLWTQTYHGNNPSYIESMSIKQTTDFGYIVSGYYSATGSSSQDDGCLIKTDANGNILWAKTYGGFAMERFEDVQQTNDGGFIATGVTFSFGIQVDIYLVKTDSIGDTLWTKTFGGNLGEYGLCVKQTADGGYIVAGVGNDSGTSCDVYLIKTTSNGDTLWTKSYGGPGIDQYLALSIEQTTDNGYIIAGQQSFNGSSRAYMIKTNAYGDTLWTKSYNSGGRFASVYQTTDGGYIAGGMDYTAIKKNDIYLVKTDSLGYACNAYNNLTIATNFPTFITDPPTIVASLFLTADSAICFIGSGGIVTNVCTFVDVNEIKNNFTINIYPNPVSSVLSIQIQKSNYRQIIFEIKNILGQTLLSKQENNISDNYIKTINLDFLSQGLYFLQVNVDGESTVKKFVKG